MLARPPSLLAAIARDVGVSKSTVSSVLNGRHRERRISERVAALVLDASRRHGCQPGAAARVRRIALASCCRSERTSPFLNVWRGAMFEAAARGVKLALAPLPDDERAELELPRLAREDGSDGLIVDLIHGQPSISELIERQNITAVFVNAKLERRCAYPDDRAAARRLTEALLALGHRRIGFVGFAWQAHYSAVERRAGHREALDAASVAALEILDLPVVQSRQAEALTQRFGDRWPTAVIAYSPPEAVLVCRAAELAGLRVPDDVCVASFADELEHWRFLAPLGAVSMLVPSMELGRTAVRLLCELLEHGDRDLPSCAVPYQGMAGELALPRG